MTPLSHSKENRKSSQQACSLTFARLSRLFLEMGFVCLVRNPIHGTSFADRTDRAFAKMRILESPRWTVFFWKTPLPSGLSCPVLFWDQIFLTGYEKNRLGLGAGRKIGKSDLEEKCPQSGNREFHASGSPATPTPFVERDRLFVYFGSFGLFCYDHEGKELWKKPLATLRSLYGTSCSPIAYGDADSVTDDDATPTRQKVSRSRILALSKKNGRTLWERHRPFHRAMVHPNPGKGFPRMELVVLGNGSLRGTLFRTERKMAGRRLFQETIPDLMTGNGKVYASGSRLEAPPI